MSDDNQMSDKDKDEEEEDERVLDKEEKEMDKGDNEKTMTKIVRRWQGMLTSWKRRWRKRLRGQ